MYILHRSTNLANGTSNPSLRLCPCDEKNHIWNPGKVVQADMQGANTCYNDGVLDLHNQDTNVDALISVDLALE